MRTGDLVSLSFGSLRGHRLRTALSMLGIGIGITAVILLTSIGEGSRRYILAQFTQFGTNILAINPGKTETFGIPGVMGGTTRKLTIDDSEALWRAAHVEKVVPFAYGQARVEAGALGRSIFVYGVTSEMPDVWKFRVRQGTFLPEGDPRRAAPFAVLGPTVKRELFGAEGALGKFVRIAGQRFRVIGIMEPKGRMLGFDIDDAVYVPVASAMKMFNLDELNEIDVLFSNERQTESVVRSVTEILTERHGGKEDFTITTQTAMLEVFDNVMYYVKLSVGGIAGISLVVGAIGILTMMWIAVNERTSEIGLIRALGGTSAQVSGLFIAEATVLALLGGALGVGTGLGIAALMRAAVPGIPVTTPPEYILAALAVSLTTGLVSGVVPALRAAGLDPIEALRTE